MTTILHYVVGTKYITDITKLNEDEMFLSTEWIHNVIVPPIIITIVTVTLLHIVLVSIVSKMVLVVVLDNNEMNTNTNTNANTTTTSSNTPTVWKRQHKFAYQMINLITNFVLGTWGFYCVVVQTPNTNYYSTSTGTTNNNRTETINGYNENVVFACIQVGYQLWSIIIGIYYVNEELIMIGHHIAVIITCTVPIFFTNGFRYYTPFFYGIIELSSVPLAITNYFKENPLWIQLYPVQYTYVRIVFAFLFLILRVLWFIPIMCHFLLDLYILFSYNNNTNTIFVYRIYMSTVWISSFALLLLQLYWGRLIAIGLLKHFFPKASSSSMSSSSTTGSKNSSDKKSL